MHEIDGARHRLIATLRKNGIIDARVIQAMKIIPRHEFVPKAYRDFAYADRPLPIGHGQTISQPSTVAWMTQLLDLNKDDRVLEIGTGSGYQAAVLAALAGHVYSIEINATLSAQASAVFSRLGYKNIETRQGDGYMGWPGGGPFDAICVTAAPDHIPEPLLDQLRDGGRLVAPIGPADQMQTLWKVVREGGDFRRQRYGPVAFVPFVRPRDE